MPYHRSFTRFLALAGLLLLSTGLTLPVHAQARQQKPAQAKPPAQAPAQAPAAAPAPEIVPNTGHSRELKVLAISPDGRVAASGGMDDFVKLWDTATGREMRVLGHGGHVESLAFSPDGRILATASSDLARMWDVATGRLIRSGQTNGSHVHAVAFSPDGKLFASGGADKTIRLWDAATGQHVKMLSGHTEAVTRLLFSPNRNVLVSGGHDKTVRVWDLERDRELHTLTGHREPIEALAISPGGRIAASGAHDRTIRVWDITTGRDLGLVRVPDLLSALSFSPDGKRLAAGFALSGMRLFDTATGQRVASLAHKGHEINALAYTPDGTSMLFGSEDDGVPSLRLWDLTADREVRRFGVGAKGHSIASMSVAADGRTIFAIDEAGWLLSWDVFTGRLVGASSGERESRVISPDGRALFEVNAEEKPAAPDQPGVTKTRWEYFARISDVETGELLSRWAKPPGELDKYTISPDNRLVAAVVGPSGSNAPRAVHVWDASTGGEVGRFEAQSDAMGHLAFSPDGGTLAASDLLGRSLRLWEVATGRVVATIAFKYGISRIHFSPDGRSFLLAEYGQLQRRSSATGELIRNHADLKTIVNFVAFSPDGKLFIACTSGETKLWDAESGREIAELKGHQGRVQTATFAPDGRTVVTGGEDKTVRRWTLSGELIATSFVATPRTGMSSLLQWLTITPEGFFDGSERAAELLSIVRGVETSSIEQVYQALYRPDLVRARLAGDPRGKVRQAAAKLDLARTMGSGPVPAVKLGALPADLTDQATIPVEITDRGGGIGTVEWRVNGMTVGIDKSGSARPKLQKGVLRLSKTLSLEPGQNTVEVIAYNGADLVASVPQTIEVKAQPTAGAAPRLFVLALAVNAYADKSIRLEFAVPDARRLAEAFRKTGAGVFSDTQVVTLFDQEVRRADIEQAIRKLAGRMRPTDTFVLYAAGHGVTVDGRYFFIPQDFRKDRPVATTAIAQDQWQQWLALIPARKSILLFDTCESGTLAEGGDTRREVERQAAAGRLGHATGRTVIAAAASDQAAFEGFRGHGLFTYSLLEALERADADGNGRLDVGELAAYVYVSVTSKSEEVFGDKQVPQLHVAGRNHDVARPQRVLDAPEPGLALPKDETHQMRADTDVLLQPFVGARRLRRINAGTKVTFVRSEAGFSLVARDGLPLGFVERNRIRKVQEGASPGR